MFLFERALAAKGKNREARPGGVLRQQNDRRGLPILGKEAHQLLGVRAPRSPSNTPYIAPVK